MYSAHLVTLAEHSPRSSRIPTNAHATLRSLKKEKEEEEEDLGGVWNTRRDEALTLEHHQQEIYSNQATILRHCLDTRISRHVYKDPRDKLRMAAVQPHASYSMGVR
ncbi:hypothetical protein M0802_004525 [Mischocyttarus mexicanus]|nr:hypothetical protein M0802_004525 [Mischocyttarus mexicanus]